MDWSKCENSDYYKLCFHLRGNLKRIYFGVVIFQAVIMVIVMVMVMTSDHFSGCDGDGGDATDGGCPKCHLSDADSDDDGPHEKRTHKLGVIHIFGQNK